MAANDIIQLGYVCRLDRFDETVQYWQDSAGAGPCWALDVDVPNQEWYGQPTGATFHTGFTYVGAMQIEIIAPRNDESGPPNAALAVTPDPPRAGIAHHIQFSTYDFDATVAELVAGGSTIAWTTQYRGRKVAYLESNDTFGLPFVEVGGPKPAEAIAAAELMLRLTAQWDRKTDPIRPYSDILAAVAGR